MKQEEGLRYNSGKTRHDLVPAFAQAQLAHAVTYHSKVFGKNWWVRYRWSSLLNMLHKRLNLFEHGVDFHPGSGLLNIAHVMEFAAYLTEHQMQSDVFDDRTVSIDYPAQNYVPDPEIDYYNEITWTLIPKNAQEIYARVLTRGAEKYAERNWEKGMKWSKVIASLKRHLNAFELGEDMDPESALPHMAHVMCNAAFLIQYMHTCPHLDDRPGSHITGAKIGLDIDEIVVDFIGGYCEKYGHTEPTSWNFDPLIAQRMEELRDDQDFWLNLKPKIDPLSMPFEPHCYITNRPIPSEWTTEWLRRNNFPVRSVITIHGSKVEACQDNGIDIFVDDRYENYVTLNSAGVFCYLMDAPHNRRYTHIGHHRIYKLSDIVTGDHLVKK